MGLSTGTAFTMMFRGFPEYSFPPLFRHWEYEWEWVKLFVAKFTSESAPLVYMTCYCIPMPQQGSSLPVCIPIVCTISLGP